MAGENTGAGETQTIDAYDEFSNVFDTLIDKEGTNDNAATDTTGQEAGAANTSYDTQQSGQPANGAGDSGESAAAAGNAATENGQGSQAAADANAAGGDQGAQGVADNQQTGQAGGDPDWKAEFERLQAQITQMQQGQQPAQPAPAQGGQQAASDAPPPIYSADEQAELANLQKEWPDIHRLFTLMARQLQVDTLNYAFSEVSQVVTPLQQMVNGYATNDHTSAIYEAHPDYDQVYQPVMDWIENQPSFLKAACQNVVKEGTAEDVAQMIQRFKDETKWQAPASSGKPAPAPATPAAAANAAPSQPNAGLSDAAKKAAQTMGAVGGKRGAAAGAQDPNDFDGAWDEAVAPK